MSLDVATLAEVGASITAFLGAIGYFAARDANLRKAIEEGDDDVRQTETTARTAVANAYQRTADELRRDVEQLKRDSFPRAEARDMEGRIRSDFSRVETKLDRQGEQIGQLLAIDGSLKACTDQVRELTNRLNIIRP